MGHAGTLDPAATGGSADRGGEGNPTVAISAPTEGIPGNNSPGGYDDDR